MNRYIPTISFLIIAILVSPLSLQPSVSVVPGTHSPVLAPYVLLSSILTVIILINTLLYLKAARTNKAIRTTIFLRHLLLTLPVLLQPVFSRYISDAQVLMYCIAGVVILFITGQFYFLSAVFTGNLHKG